VSDARDPLGLTASPRRIRVVARATRLDDAALRRGLAIATETPPPGEWASFLSRALALLGTGLLLAGAVSFVAFNWDRIGRFGKFALVEIAIVGAAVFAWTKLPRISGEVALLAAAVLVGPLLAVFGQTYQTGADPYGLFLTWSLIIVPWVLASRLSALWMLDLALLELAIALYWSQVVGPTSMERMLWLPITLSAINLAALAAWEWQRGRDTPLLTERWAQRVLGVAAAYGLWIAGAAFVVGGWSGGVPGTIAVVMLGAVILAALRHYRPRGDRFMVTIAVTAGMAWVTVLVGRIVFEVLDLYAFGLLVMSGFVLWQISVGLKWYRGMRDAP
jgi:uncharacterized membrane protein